MMTLGATWKLMQWWLFILGNSCGGRKLKGKLLKIMEMMMINDGDLGDNDELEDDVDEG